MGLPPLRERPPLVFASSSSLSSLSPSSVSSSCRHELGTRPLASSLRTTCRWWYRP
ncbi:hypothetical protein PR003_g17233 [Phytophthora rubi]|uniref:Uncharacterized protein n=1 Tax=Phytophthora rubi TaxID=129364 RepID=A0A6A3J1V1_9STRA|nr:hypothetical protein PR002_g21812 [Phytophthora rubi]KAE8989176.1 hypothetical protein PR001_g21842 [Phytophthora rubi]KAE9322450.1 hypothetical protein PR003_g17233 [Phytophthora rubi]